MTPKSIKNKKMWAYFAPDGSLQVRTLGDCKKDSRQEISRHELTATWRDYERDGFYLRKVIVNISIIPL